MKKTRYQEVKDKISLYIRENRLQPGDKLPTYRELADLFGVSTNTIGQALERLHYRGVIDIRPQSGVFLRDEAWHTLYPDRFNWQDYFNKSKEVPIKLLKRFSESRKRSASTERQYVISNIGLSPEFGWYAPWKKSVESALRNTPPEHLFIPPPEEVTHLKNTMGEYLKYYGVEASPENILLSKGTNHSLLYIMLTFFSPGTVCYYVSPSMLDIAAVFELTGFIKTPLPCPTRPAPPC